MAAKDAIRPFTFHAPDADLADIDRLARRYTGNEFRRRGSKRVSAWLEPDRWHAWS